MASPARSAKVARTDAHASAPDADSHVQKRIMVTGGYGLVGMALQKVVEEVRAFALVCSSSSVAIAGQDPERNVDLPSVVRRRLAVCSSAWLLSVCSLLWSTSRPGGIYELRASDRCDERDPGLGRP